MYIFIYIGLYLYIIYIYIYRFMFAKACRIALGIGGYDRQLDGQINGRTDKWTDGQTGMYV